MVRAQRRKYHYIYKITNKLNGKFYIGMHSTDNLDDGYFGSGKYLKRSIEKHGKEFHEIEILEHYFSREDLVAREKELVNIDLLQNEMCMNLRLGGEGGDGWYFVNAFPETKDKIQALRSKAGNTAFIEKLENDEEFRDQFSTKVSRSNENRKGTAPKASFVGRIHSDETLRKMRKSKNIGESNSQFGLRWIHNTELKFSKRIQKSDNLPEGWQEGRKMKFQ